MNEQANRTTFFGACPHDCPDTCAMVYEVDDGKLVHVKGNKEHPITRGTLCVKLKDFHDHHHNPDRLMYPLRRVGPKGSGPNGGNNFERITWDEAISEIGRRWREIIAEYGARPSCRKAISATWAWCRASTRATRSSIASARR